MNSHKSVRTKYAGRKFLIERIRVVGLMLAAEAAGISVRTTRKWLRRFETSGKAGLMDRSSRPDRTRKALGIRHSFTRPNRPQSNGKAECFI